MSIFETKYVDINEVMMCWGKYGPSGDMGHTKIVDLPDDYLLWLLEKAESDSLKPSWLNDTIKEVWRNRYEKKEEVNKQFKEEAERLRKEDK